MCLPPKLGGGRGGIAGVLLYKRRNKKNKRTARRKVSSPKSSLIQQQRQHHPLDLELGLDAEIRLKRLCTIEEIKEYTVELSNLTMQGLRVWNNNGSTASTMM